MHISLTLDVTVLFPYTLDILHQSTQRTVLSQYEQMFIRTVLF